MPIIETNFHRN